MSGSSLDLCSLRKLLSMKSFYNFTQWLLGVGTGIPLVFLFVATLTTPKDPDNSGEWMGMIFIISFFFMIYLGCFWFLSWMIRSWMKDFSSVTAKVFTVFLFIIAGIPAILEITYNVALCGRLLFDWIHR